MTRTTPEPRVVPAWRAPSKESERSRSSGVTKLPAAPPRGWLQRPAPPHPARQLEEVAEGGAHRQLVEPRALDGARDAEEPRAGGPGSRGGIGPLPGYEDLKHIEERLDVVDPGGLAEKPAVGSGRAACCVARGGVPRAN